MARLDEVIVTDPLAPLHMGDEAVVLKLDTFGFPTIVIKVVVVNWGQPPAAATV